MLDSSLFVSENIHERTIKLPDGSEHKMWFKELTAFEFRKFYIAEKSDDEEKQAASIARLIASSLVEEDGKPAISFKQALKLTAIAANALSSTVLEVNGFGEKQKND